MLFHVWYNFKSPLGVLLSTINISRLIATYCFNDHLFIHYDLPYTWETKSFIAIVTILFLFSLISLLRTIFTNPGTSSSCTITSPKDKYNAMKNNTYCRECRNVCPDGAYHCSICKGCILQHNQHSYMVNNCIGLRNQKSYISYLLFTSLFDIVNVVYSTFMIWKINQLSDNSLYLFPSIITLPYSYFTELNNDSLSIFFESDNYVFFLLLLSITFSLLFFIFQSTFLTQQFISLDSDEKEDVFCSPPSLIVDSKPLNIHPFIVE